MGESSLSDQQRVEAVLRALDEAAERWEAVVAEAETTTYSVEMGDLSAVADSDGQLIGLSLSPTAVEDYSYGELAERLNLAFTALRTEAQDDFEARYGGGLQ